MLAGVRHPVLGVVGLVGIGLPGSSDAFTGPPAAIRLVREMRAAYAAAKAVDDVITGDIVYCPSVADDGRMRPNLAVGRARGYPRRMTSPMDIVWPSVRRSLLGDIPIPR